MRALCYEPTTDSDLFLPLGNSIQEFYILKAAASYATEQNTTKSKKTESLAYRARIVIPTCKKPRSLEHVTTM
jgi:hypothetical protein